MESLLLSFGSLKMEWYNAVIALGLSFLLASILAVVYEKTFRGLSWSSGLVQSMILGPMVSCLIMIAIGDNVARGIGIVGSLAIIRFRTNLRDPRDLIFLFAALGIGVACGVRSYTTAIAGTLLFCTAAVVLQFTRFGQRRNHDGMVRFQVPADPAASAAVAQVFRDMTAHFALVSKRSVSQGEYMDFAYQVRFRKPEDCDDLLVRLEGISGMKGLVYVNEQTTVEV